MSKKKANTVTPQDLEAALTKWKNLAGVPLGGDRVDAFINGAISFANFLAGQTDSQ